MVISKISFDSEHDDGHLFCVTTGPLSQEIVTISYIF